MTVPASSTRLFKSDFIEWFSKVHPATPFFLYIPVIVAVLVYAILQAGFSMPAILVAFSIGVAAWTLSEYLLHRFVFHLAPKAAWAKRFIYILHENHHDYPQDGERLVMPPIVSLGVKIGVYSVAYWLMGVLGLCLVAGWTLGYLYYDFSHYVIHRRKGFRGFEFQRRNHLIHHFQDHNICFGVTSPLWDYVFGTRPPVPSHSS